MDFVRKDVRSLCFINNESVDMTFCYNDALSIPFIVDGMPLKYNLVPDYQTNGYITVEDMDSVYLDNLDRYELWQFAAFINDAIFIHAGKFNLDIQ